METDLDSEASSDKNENDAEKKQNETVSKRKGKKYKCDYPGCNAVFPRPHKLQNHLNLHTGERPYKCTFDGCDKSYTNSSHLKRHLQTHSSVSKTFICTFCSVSMSTMSNLRRHYKRAHNQERELYCHQCSIFFRKKSNYAEHMAAHDKSTIYKCEKCGKVSASSMKLKKHMQSHRPKNYECPVENCSEVFGKWALMVEHKNTKHEIVFPCSKCKKVFLTRSYLKTHSKIHVKDRPAIPCSFEGCQRLYYFRRNLNNHIRIKHIGNKFHCDICNVKLSAKKKIEEHIINQHLSEKKPFKRKAPSPRIDMGLAKRSVLSQLTGIYLSVNAEVKLMQRNPVALMRDKAVEDSSFSEDDRASDVSAKGA